ncbi:plasmid mobilization relaxosome protein MobC (plasmid) [Brevundimonas staleyi]|uniref:Plasmid mobilization relaxosome protein MobC n=1 Tax=Brevundimonas staleyi TaxID=74326 RepID=A0ABW0FNT5_9CAUL
MAFFGVRLTDDFAARFDAFASSKGGRSVLLRRLMAEAMTAGGLEPAPDGPGPARGQSDKLTLRLKADDRAALDSASGAAGMRRTEWALACLRGRLFRKPQFNAGQALALVEARQELARISTNLRELVRAVRDGDLAADAVSDELAKVEAFRREVRDQLDGVRAAIDGAGDYWEAA